MYDFNGDKVISTTEYVINLCGLPDIDDVEAMTGWGICKNSATDGFCLSDFCDDGKNVIDSNDYCLLLENYQV
jgi:hypothetical protein